MPSKTTIQSKTTKNTIQSKTTKNITRNKTSKKRCTYKYIRGRKKNTICNAMCRGDLCKKHKASRIQRKKDYYGDNVIENIKNRLKNGEEIDSSEYQTKHRKCRNSVRFVYKQIVGIDIFLGDIDEKTAFEKYDPIFNEYLYDNEKELKERMDNYSKTFFQDHKKKSDESKKEILKKRDEYIAKRLQDRNTRMLVNAFKKSPRFYIPFEITNNEDKISNPREYRKVLMNKKNRYIQKQQLLYKIICLLEKNNT